jgi:hypothetical protein
MMAVGLPRRFVPAMKKRAMCIAPFFCSGIMAHFLVLFKFLS